ncbi:SLAP domain-containing protein [Lactobacillus sp. ESL0785]|uniref:SLAP domain-containing protein n=1 Tax=Lactobacillus sp. ESL0785 TaxID=2983232 RepID=UPI0023F806DA|nr:SLAP domain-containing protein [Lactobacillus sp. ESL0785]WEV70246.1 SLAP domain-containing protein [Lactobacillus sp. ESL0785]
MNKKLLLTLACAAALSVGLTDVAQVSAATTETTNSTNDNKQPATTTDTNQSKPTKPAAKPSKTDSSSKGNTTAISYIGRNVKLKRNSYVYNKKGKRINISKLKKNTIVTVSGFTNVNGKNLLQINKKNQYILANNVKTFRAAGYKVKKKSYVYNSKGKLIPGIYIAKGKFVPVVKAKEINGIKFVGITETQFIKWSNLNHKSGKILNQ